MDSDTLRMGSKSTSHSLKQKISELEDDNNDNDDYRSITKTMLPEEGDTKFDRYLIAPITSFAKEKTLD